MLGLLYHHGKTVAAAKSALSTLCQDAVGPNSRCLSTSWAEKQGKYRCQSQAECSWGPGAKADRGRDPQEAGGISLLASAEPVWLWPLEALVR